MMMMGSDQKGIFHQLIEASYGESVCHHVIAILWISTQAYHGLHERPFGSKRASDSRCLLRTDFVLNPAPSTKDKTKVSELAHRNKCWVGMRVAEGYRVVGEPKMVVRMVGKAW